VKPYIFHPEAEGEYVEAAHYYTEIDPELGGRFFDEVERLILELRLQPDRFWQFDPPLRRHLSTIFPHAVVYWEQPDRIWIVAVMHGSRKPGYWRQRLG
jgi:toxin ParE1/3/4